MASIYRYVERFAIEYTVRRHKVIVRLREKLSAVVLARLLGTYDGEKEIVIRCRTIGHWCEGERFPLCINQRLARRIT